MSNARDGYVTDVGYTPGYYTGLNPLHARIPLLVSNWLPPDVTTACELGCGLGVSVAIHAAAGDATWYANDFNPEHVAYAQAKVAAGGATAHVSDRPFDEFCARDDLPAFDFIGLHGIWSWISDANRRTILAFIERKLRPGGLVYVSYNTLPGWAQMLPLRDLLYTHASRASGPGASSTERLEQALAFAQRVADSEPRYGETNPAGMQRLARIGEQDMAYAAHEYINRDWEPMSFATAAAWFEDAQLTYVGSADPLAGLDNLHLTDAQRELLDAVGDPVLRETTRDLLVNQQFRRDYWIKGARRLGEPEADDRLRRERVVLQVPRSEASYAVKSVRGEVNLHTELALPVLDALADNAPRTVGELADRVCDGTVTFTRLKHTLLALLGNGALAPARRTADPGPQATAAAALNRHLGQAAARGEGIPYMASPVIGGGLRVSKLHQTFLRAENVGADTAQAKAATVWSWIKRNGQRVMKDGAPLEGDEANQAELTRRASRFDSTDRPVLSALGAMPAAATGTPAKRQKKSSKGGRR